MPWGACVWWRLRWALRLPGLISPVIRTLRGQVRIPAASRTDAAVAAVEAFLDQPPLRLRQPQICPGLGLPPFLPGSSGHAMSASSCTSPGRPLRPPPHRFRRPSAHVQLTSGTVRMKSAIELANSHMTQFTWVFVMDCVRAIIALTWGSWGYGPAERWHLLPRPNYLIRIMPA